MSERSGTVVGSGGLSALDVCVSVGVSVFVSATDCVVLVGTGISDVWTFKEERKTVEVSSTIWVCSNTCVWNLVRVFNTVDISSMTVVCVTIVVLVSVCTIHDVDISSTTEVSVTSDVAKAVEVSVMTSV